MIDFLVVFAGAFSGAACGLLAAAKINQKMGSRRHQELSDLAAARDDAIFAAVDAGVDAMLTNGDHRDALEELRWRRIKRNAAATAYAAAFAAAARGQR